MPVLAHSWKIAFPLLVIVANLTEMEMREWVGVEWKGRIEADRLKEREDKRKGRTQKDERRDGEKMRVSIHKKKHKL